MKYECGLCAGMHMCLKRIFPPPAVAVDEGWKTSDLLNVLGLGIVMLSCLSVFEISLYAFIISLK